VKNLNQTSLFQTNRSSVVSDTSSLFSISSSPNISRSIPQQPTAPLDNRFSYLSNNRFSYLSNNRLSILSENSSQISISSSPSITSPTQQPSPTAPSETLLYNNKNFENNQQNIDPYSLMLQKEKLHQQSINSNQLYPTSLMNHFSSPLKAVIMNIPESPTSSSPTLENINSTPSTATNNNMGTKSDAILDNPKSPESEATLAQESSSDHEEEIETKIATHVCKAWYSPMMADELRMCPGDELIILEKFDDGWALGHNTENNVGIFPLDCVTLIDYD